MSVLTDTASVDRQIDVGDGRSGRYVEAKVCRQRQWLVDMAELTDRGQASVTEEGCGQRLQALVKR